MGHRPAHHTKLVDYTLLAQCIAMPFGAGAIGSLFTFEAINGWYAGLTKPFFNPPNWIFGPVWTLLYIMMGVAHYLYTIHARRNAARRAGMEFYYIQLAFNALWSILFFGFHLPVVAFGEIILLWLFVFLTYRFFKKAYMPAGLLLIPYMIWIAFAGLLNLSIVVLN